MKNNINMEINPSFFTLMNAGTADAVRMTVPGPEQSYSTGRCSHGDTGKTRKQVK
jgi:hypothetical protein